MSNEHLNEPDPIERVLRGIADPQELVELSVAMTELAMDRYRTLILECPADELVERMPELSAKAKQLTDENMDADIRRWLIGKGYL